MDRNALKFVNVLEYKKRKLASTETEIDAKCRVNLGDDSFTSR